MMVVGVVASRQWQRTACPLPSFRQARERADQAEEAAEQAEERVEQAEEWADEAEELFHEGHDDDELGFAWHGPRHDGPPHR